MSQFDSSSKNQSHWQDYDQEIDASVQASVVNILGASAHLNGGIASIPPEILQEIFVHSLPEVPFIWPSASRAPLSLGLVSRNWRRLSITCPHLWTSISLSIPSLSGFWLNRGPAEGLVNFYSKVEAGVEQWLSRSGSLPLTIRYEEPTFQEHVSARIRKLFTAVASRWRCVEIGWRSDQEELLALLSSGSQTPLLEELSLGPGMMTQRPLNFSRLTNLYVLSTMGILHHPGEIILPPQLTHISADGLDLHNALKLLQGCPSLVSAKLYIFIPTPLTSTVHILHPHVKTLSVEFPSMPSAAEFWDSLTLPALKTFEVGSHSLGWPSEPLLPAHVPTMLQRSRCDLEHLVIRNSCMEDMIACLALSPNLQYLTFESLNDRRALSMISSILERLTDRSLTNAHSSLMLCLKLRRLSISECSPLNHYRGSLINFLVSRSQVEPGDTFSVTYLEELEWEISASMDSSHDIWKSSIEGNAPLQECIRGGLRIYLSIGGTRYLYGPDCLQGMCLD